MTAVKKIKKAIKHGVIQPVRETVLRANYRRGNYKEAIWLIGAARSGTTWISNLLNHEKRLREMFEPFHPRFVEPMTFLLPHQYTRPDEPNEKLEKIAADVFSGRFVHPRVDQGNRSLVYHGLLVKDVFANLFACWTSNRFPQVKPVLLIRNPFAVALSVCKAKNWFWAKEPLDFLKQTNLVEDHLHPFEEIIRKTSAEQDPVLCQILIWSILNTVPLRQFVPGQCHICFYEDVLSDPEREISNIMRFVNPAGPPVSGSLKQKMISRPSRTTLSGERGSWQSELSSQQIDAGLNILNQFGFAELYDESGKPARAVLQQTAASRGA